MVLSLKDNGKNEVRKDTECGQQMVAVTAAVEGVLSHLRESGQRQCLCGTQSPGLALKGHSWAEQTKWGDLRAPALESIALGLCFRYPIWSQESGEGQMVETAVEKCY